MEIVGDRTPVYLSVDELKMIERALKDLIVKPGHDEELKIVSKLWLSLGDKRFMLQRQLGDYSVLE